MEGQEAINELVNYVHENQNQNTYIVQYTYMQFLSVQPIINVGVVNIKCGCGLSSTYVYLLPPPLCSLKRRRTRYILREFFQIKKPIMPPVPTSAKRIIKVTPKIMPTADTIVVFLGCDEGRGLL